MNSMKNPWFQDLTIFFENLGKTNLRSTIKRRRSSKICKSKPSVLYNFRPKLSLMDYQKVNTSLDSEESEHCYKVKVAKEIFEKMRSTDKIDSNRHLSSFKKTVSVYDIFSGNVTDLDIPPIEDEIEEDGVYPRADISTPDNSKLASVAPSTASNINSALKLVIEKKKSIAKSASFVDRKHPLKKGSTHFKSVSSESDADKENNGVIIRMKNQETYYDGRTKYTSLLPEVPMCRHGVESKRPRRSLYAQKAVDKSLDVPDDEVPHVKAHVNSIMLQDVSLPPIDNNHNILEDICMEEDCNDSDELEPIGDCDSTIDAKLLMMKESPQRIKWAETDEGKKLIKMRKLSSDLIHWQEAQFEVITSEASYYRSLQTLVNKVYKSPLMCCKGEKKSPFCTDTEYLDTNDVMSPAVPTSPTTLTGPSSQFVMTALQKHHLFSNILEIHICSEELLKALETRWRENPFIEDLSDILISFSKEKLRPYITYLRNHQYQTSTYNELLTKPEFQNVIRALETDIEFGMLNLGSFLLLPMQRLLRLKLLFNAIMHYTPEGYPTEGCQEAINKLEMLIRECSIQKTVMDQKEEIMKIYNRLIIKEQAGYSIGTKPLLKDGELKVRASNSDAARLLKSGFISRNNDLAKFYLFEDQLIIAKTRKLPMCFSSPDDREIVVDICPRANIQFSIINPSKTQYFSKNSINSIFKISLKKDDKRCPEYLCEVDSPTVFEEWEKCLSSDDSQWESLESNDAFVVNDYSKGGGHELDLKRGQILNIIRTLGDGRAIARMGDQQGEIELRNVCVVSPDQSNGNRGL